MRKFISKLLLFCVIMMGVDLVYGIVCDYLNSHAKGGTTGTQYYIAKQTSEDIVMMGSSRMHHHYVPQVIEESLGMTAYNAGIDGNGIILSYGYLLMITARYTPQVIIYDISSFDCYKDDNTKYLNNLKEFYKEPGIKDIFLDVDKTERWKMISSLYRYNSKFLQLLTDYIHPVVISQKGYVGINQTMKHEPKVTKEESQREMDPLKINYIKKFIEICKEKDIILYFCVSPVYNSKESDSDYHSIKEICQNNNIMFFDYHWDTEISTDKKYFSDRTHMNDEGAKQYTQKICKTIKDMIKYNK